MGTSGSSRTAPANYIRQLPLLGFNCDNCIGGYKKNPRNPCQKETVNDSNPVVSLALGAFIRRNIALIARTAA
jgi:hypothetical protein